MTIRAKLSLMSVGLLGAVVLAVAVGVTAAERSALRDQSRRRLQGLSDGVARIARESVENRDQLMLLSYLMQLQKEHEEFVYASVTTAERTSVIGADRPGLVYLRDSVEAGGKPDAAALVLGFDGAALDAELARALEPLARRTALIAGVFMLLGWLAALSLSRRLTAPLTALSAAVSAVKAGNLDVAVPAGGDDEAAALSARFNEMTAHLRELTKFREDLLHTLTHELNVPLGGIKGYLELWQDRKLPLDGPDRDEVLQTMTAAVLRMEQSLGNALALFRKDALDAKKTSVWVSDLLREACTLFAPEAAAKKIRLQPPPDNSAAHVHGDPELLRRIAANLVSNAVKYVPEGGHVSLEVEAGPDTVTLRVGDDGVGIPPEDLPHLFTKFYRAGPDERQRRVKGTGLGLSIAQKAAQELGGSISVESEPGRGTVFTVVLPKFAPLKEAL